MFLADTSLPLVQSLVFGRLQRLGVPLNAFTGALYSFAIVAVVFVPAISLVPMFCIWWERKVAGRIQSRIGPNRVGPIGLLQSIADGAKLLLKEDLVPKAADPLLFRLAAYLAFTPVFAAFVALPFAPDFTFEPRLAAGLFWILAMLSVEVMGVILAGYSSNNKWSLYGAMRQACQMVSYEIPLGLSIIVAVCAAGTLNLVQLGHQQAGGIHTWLIFRNPFTFLAFIVYFVASLASNKRAPFDLPESESELVAGFHTEYSGLRFSFFFFAEYAGMFVVGGIQAALFLGGWNDPFGLIGMLYAKWMAAGDTSGLLALNVIGAAIFVGKALLIIYVQMWLRWTLPRPRIDQVLYACVKVLLPMACALLVGVTLWELFIPHLPAAQVQLPNAPDATARYAVENPWLQMNPWNFAEWGRRGAMATLVTQLILSLVGVTLAGACVGWVGYAIVTGRSIKQRLTEPGAIDMKPPSMITVKVPHKAPAAAAPATLAVP